MTRAALIFLALLTIDGLEIGAIWIFGVEFAKVITTHEIATRESVFLVAPGNSDGPRSGARGDVRPHAARACSSNA